MICIKAIFFKKSVNGYYLDDANIRNVHIRGSEIESYCDGLEIVNGKETKVIRVRMKSGKDWLFLHPGYEPFDTIG